MQAAFDDCPDFGHQCLNISGTGLDYQLALVLTNVLTQKVEAVSDMRDPCLGL